MLDLGRIQTSDTIETFEMKEWKSGLVLNQSPILFNFCYMANHIPKLQQLTLEPSYPIQDSPGQVSVAFAEPSAVIRLSSKTKMCPAFILIAPAWIIFLSAVFWAFKNWQSCLKAEDKYYNTSDFCPFMGIPHWPYYSYAIFPPTSIILRN